MNAATLLAAAALLICATARAEGFIETPTINETVSGIATISGWNCTARTVTVKIDAYPEMIAGSGTERKDTAGVCGQGNINTGFSLLLNYNDLPTGAHTLVAFADGLEFGRVNFTTVTLGVPFLVGKSGQRLLRNFPDMNQSVIVQWQQNRQNFAIVGRGNGTTPNPAPIGGIYYGAAGTQCATDPQPTMQDERFARFEVTGSTDNQTLTVQVRYADGFACTLTGAMTNGLNGYFVVASPTSTCGLGNSNLRIEVDGIRLKGVLGTVVGAGCFTTRAFYGARPYSLE
ncbi:MAG: hypothetical protein ACXWF2_04990 [Usitatibacter sp.]